MLNIAMNGVGKTTSITDISRKEGLSVSYLEQLLNKLRREGLIESIRGPKGGYVLSREASDITVGDIVKVMEGSLYTARCVTANSGDRAVCKKSNGCVPRLVWLKLAKSIGECLDSITLKELCSEAKKIKGK